MRISRNKRNKEVKAEEIKTLEVKENKIPEVVEGETKEVIIEEVKETSAKTKKTAKTVCRVVVATPSYFVINKNGEIITVNKSNNYHRNEEILY